MLVFAQASYWERHEQTLECIKRLHDYVDRIVIIEPDYDDYWCMAVKKKYPKVEFHMVEWKDNFPEYRNEYLKRCKPGDWVCVADPDEWYDEKLCRDLRKITDKADRQGITLLLVNSHDILTDMEGKTTTSISSFYKNLIFKYEEGVHYKGVGQAKNVHETLICAKGKSITLDRKYYYEHHKTQLEVWERAFRNVWVGGGGNNAGERNPAWKPLREITEKLGLKTWPEVRAYLRKGDVDKSLLDWIVQHRNDGGWDYENETGECFLYYFAMHPEENIEKWKREPKAPSRGSPPEVMSYVESVFKKVLGREADEEGKRVYTNQILTGKIKREELPSILKLSKEYLEKFPEEKQKMRIQVPVDVDVKLNEENIIKAMMMSYIYWTKIKPRLEFGKKWERILAIARKEETRGKGIDTANRLDFEPWVKMFKEYAPPEEYQNILDVGAGSGCEASVLMEHGYSVMGITFGKENIKYAREKFGVQLLEMDMHNLQFPENFFDGAYLQQTFEHAVSGWILVLELRKVLRDGGRVFIDVPDPDDEPMYTIWHINLLYPRQIRHLFELGGFKLVKDLTEKHRIHMIFEKLPDGTFKSWSYIKYMV